MDSYDRFSIPVERIDISEEDRPRCSLDMEIVTSGETIRDDSLRLQNFSGQESISQEFEFSLDIRANDYWYSDSEQIIDSGIEDDLTNIDLDTLLGSSITVMIGLPETDEDLHHAYPEARKVSYFNGIIHNISMGDRGVWNITMKPQLSILHLQSSYRIFTHKSIIEVIGEVLDFNQITWTFYSINAEGEVDKHSTPVVKGPGLTKKQDWFQAGESDFDFLTRLMEKADLFFYFVHTHGNHTMVITDQNHYVDLLEDPNGPHYDALANQLRDGSDDPSVYFVQDQKKWAGDNLKTLYLAGPKLGIDLADTASQFSFKKNLTTASIDTLVARKNPMWDPKPKHGSDVGGVGPTSQHSTHGGRSAGLSSSRFRNMNKVQVVSYGNSVDEAEFRSGVLAQKLLSAQSTLSGSSSLTEMRSGHRFAVNGGGRERPELSRKVVVANSVSHKATIDGEYSNQFTAFFHDGFGKPFDGAADRDGSIMAKVCPPPQQDSANSLRPGSFASLSATKAMTPLSCSGEYSDELVAQKGVHVRFIGTGDQFLSEEVYFVRLSDGMTTIPEYGSLVVVGRNRDHDELPVVEQVINAHGSKTVLNDAERSKHTSVGDSYSTNYGDSISASLPHPHYAVTDYDTHNSIVEGERNRNNYRDISFHEGSPSYSVNVGYSGKNRHKSVVKPSGVTKEDQLRNFKAKIAEFDEVQNDTDESASFNGYLKNAFFNGAIEPHSIDSISHSYKGDVQSFGYSEDWGVSYSESHTHGTNYNLQVDHTSGSYSQSFVLPPSDPGALEGLQKKFASVPSAELKKAHPSAPEYNRLNNSNYTEVSQSYKGEAKSLHFSEDWGISYSESHTHGKNYNLHVDHTSGNYSQSITKPGKDADIKKIQDAFPDVSSDYDEVNQSYKGPTANSYSYSNDLGESFSESHVNTTTSNSTTGVSNSVSTTGVSNSVNTVGSTNSVNTTGVSTSISNTGMEVSSSAHGIGLHVSATGFDTDISFIYQEGIKIEKQMFKWEVKTPTVDIEELPPVKVYLGDVRISMVDLDISL